MDTLTHLSLFSGIGGLDLAAEWAGIKTVGQCEWAEYPTKVLEKHWPDVPRWKDIRTLTGRSFYERTGRRTADIISGGFPCQPFSVAGKRRGREDDRFLWPEMVRIVKELRPSWVVGENVAGIVRMELPGILSELEACGYRTRTFLIPACAVGARHRRYRVAIIGCREWAGHVEDPGGAGCGRQGDVREQQRGAGPGRAGQTVAHTESSAAGGLSVREEQEKPGPGISSEDVQYAHSTGRKEQHPAAEPGRKGFPCGGCDEGDVCNAAGKGLEDRTGRPVGGQETPEPEPERPDSHVPDTDHRGRAVRGDGELPEAEKAGSRGEDHGGRSQEHEPGERGEPEPGVGGVADGIPGRMDGYWDTEPAIPRISKGVPHRIERLKALGNAVVPQQFYPVFAAIVAAEREFKR